MTFLWGASTSPHQTEGNNLNSDWWTLESQIPGMQPSGTALDSYHRYPEDMRLLADAGLNAYRFGIEWARVEPQPGRFSTAELTHYRDMIDTAVGLGLTPVITLHHFSSPRWFTDEGGWMGKHGVERFTAYVTEICDILDGVEWVATINEPNILALMLLMHQAAASGQWQSPTVQQAMPLPDIATGRRLVEAHHAARDILHRRTGAKIGWTVANQAFTPTPGNETKLDEVRYPWEDLYLQGSAGDDWAGVQSYTTQPVDANGPVPHPPHPDNTQTGWAYRPEALGIAVRHAWQTTSLPILVTENGIATADDERRIAYTSEALRHLRAAIDDGADVRGYLHWSALDNYEWGHWEPTFGLIAVDRQTFTRHPKPSLAWLGEVARSSKDIT